ncbi:hypothetical protein KYG33_20815 [Chryseobacterium sp. D764]|uniref:hypothetical protein n=1 Tax=Chryseobacterium sp. D764 TaxID=2856522 RepID=UPI001C56F44B|nr:hypothetical protein [Chryseobacterium sp. D764]QXU49164.1 hypothetical protein KYG33_20815 [Chryseobacterium sp. D764]
MTTIKKVYSYFALLLTILISICCKQAVDTSSKNIAHNENYFIGDSILASANYFNSLKNGKGYLVLKKQNEEYLKKYSLTKNNELYLPLENNISIKLIKEKLEGKNTIKVNLFTFINNKKTDSIQFYRNIPQSELGMYNCLSYFNSKTGKIWQIKYFHSDNNKGLNIISYTERNISSDGSIKSDSIQYLDESLDLKLDELNLYY